MDTRVWSGLQQDIFEAVKNTQDNIFIRAVAGSGKTTTIEHIYTLITGTRVFLAFNKSIANELATRGLYAKTFHAICASVVHKFKNTSDVDTRKMVRLFHEIKLYRDDTLYSGYVRRLVGLGKNHAVGCKGFRPNTVETWAEIAAHYRLEFDSELCTPTRANELAVDLMQASIDDPQIDFDDMLYLAVYHDLQLPKFDTIFVDEAQDTNEVQRSILHKMFMEGGRLIAVGDENQSIYAFRGADSQAIDILVKEFNCATYPLSITYRCAKRITAYAQNWVPDIHARTDAPEGSVRHLDKWDATTFEPDDLIVARRVKEVLTVGLTLIKQHVPVTILGREIGDGLKNLAKKMGYTVDEIEANLVKWRDREMSKALKAEDENQADAAKDKADALLSVIEGLPEGCRNVETLNNVIDYLFHPNNRAVTICTIHKCKGLEARRVFWVNRDKMGVRNRKGKPIPQWEIQQDSNLCYVAATRAKEELIFIQVDEKAGMKTEVQV